MGTNTRPELKNSGWHVGKDRYYELQHFCLQYPEWKQRLRDIDGIPKSSIREHVNEGRHSDPTPLYAEDRMFYNERISMVERAASLSADG